MKFFSSNLLKRGENCKIFYSLLPSSIGLNYRRLSPTSAFIYQGKKIIEDCLRLQPPNIGENGQECPRILPLNIGENCTRLSPTSASKCRRKLHKIVPDFSLQMSGSMLGKFLPGFSSVLPSNLSSFFVFFYSYSFERIKITKDEEQ